MSYVKTKGIVIKEVNTGEADKIITLFSNDNGKMSVFARGARRPRSQLVAATQLLCYSDFVLFKGKGMYSINTCEVIQPFYEIRNDIVRLTYSAHFIDIINDVVQHEQPALRVLQLLLNTLFMLTKTEKSPQLVASIFELRLLCVLGYAPHIQGCVVCNREDLNSVAFSHKRCGFICEGTQCKEADMYAQNILQGTAKAIYHIVSSRPENLFNFNISPEVQKDLESVLRRYLKDRLERDYRKLDFLKTL